MAFESESANYRSSTSTPVSSASRSSFSAFATLPVPQQGLIITVLGVNTALYALYQSDDRRWVSWLHKHFVLSGSRFFGPSLHAQGLRTIGPSLSTSLRALGDPAAYNWKLLLTHALLHKDPLHLLSNMAGWLQCSTTILSRGYLGSVGLLTLSAAGASAGGMAVLARILWDNRHRARILQDRAGVGASGACSALEVYTVYREGGFDLQWALWWVAKEAIGTLLLQAVDAGKKVGVEAHVAGALAGLLVAKVQEWYEQSTEAGKGKQRRHM